MVLLRLGPRVPPLRTGAGPMMCVSCGRAVVNREEADNFAHWTVGGQQVPYCGDSEECVRDAYLIVDRPLLEWPDR